jgi:2-oxoglutarate ferredoxin oxidoreductase subunit alpha
MTESRPKIEVLSGNDMCAEGALAAGCTFYAGYPITPSSEIAELLARRLPARGGVFIQMEDEIASLGCAIGASLIGHKAMTATSGPGYSLMQEHIGYAAMAEVPVVIINVMRGGPSTGLPTKASQADVMQAAWGSHGDYRPVALCPATVQECFDTTVKAFAWAERFRIPVTVLPDEIVGHMRENVDVRCFEEVTPAERLRPDVPPEEYEPYAYEISPQGVPMADFGTGFRFHVTGLAHDVTGFPTNEVEEISRCNWRIIEKIEAAREILHWTERFQTEDAEVLLFAYGSVSRTARDAVLRLRSRGIRTGLFRPVTLWPFPEAEVSEVFGSARKVVVPELNAGQMAGELQKFLPRDCAVERVNRLDGEIITPAQIIEAVEKIHAGTTT